MKKMEIRNCGSQNGGQMHDNNTHANHVNKFILDVNVTEVDDALVASVGVGLVLILVSKSGVEYVCIGEKVVPDGHCLAVGLKVTNVGKAALDSNDHVAENDPSGNVAKGRFDSGVAESDAALAMTVLLKHEIGIEIDLGIGDKIKATYAIPIDKNLAIAKESSLNALVDKGADKVAH